MRRDGISKPIHNKIRTKWNWLQSRERGKECVEDHGIRKAVGKRVRVARWSEARAGQAMSRKRNGMRRPPTGPWHKPSVTRLRK